MAFRHQVYQHCQAINLSSKPTIVFAPHQDDETLGCGGLIALKRKQGVPVWVVFMTDGQGCYPDFVPISPEECAKIRKQEALEALKIIGVDKSHTFFLEHRDSSLIDLQGQQRQAALQEIQELLIKLEPQEVYVPHHKDGHSDHILTHDLVREAVRNLSMQADFWQYPVWSLWHMDGFDDLAANNFKDFCCLSVKPVQKQKSAALKQYRSQYQPVANQYKVLPFGYMSFFTSPYEIFVREPL